MVDGEPGDASGLVETSLVAGDRLVEVLGGVGDECLVGPALVGNVREPRIEQREVGARIDGKMHDAIFASIHLAGIECHCAARVDDNNAGLFDGLGAELSFLLVHRCSAQIRHPVVEEIVGLRLQRIGAHRNDSVGKLRVLITIIEFTHAHVARGMDFGVIGWTIVDADVLYLHGTEVELASAPSILVAATGTPVVESGDE